MKADNRATAPLSHVVIVAVARLIDDTQADSWREPNHSDLDFVVDKAKLSHVDPRRHGQAVGKAKRIRAVLGWALENNPEAGERLVSLLISTVRGYGGFDPESDNYVGRQAIENAVRVFRSEGFDLSYDGDLRPLLLDALSDSELTSALRAYTQRARRGVSDAALVIGTGKDLL